MRTLLELAMIAGVLVLAFLLAAPAHSDPAPDAALVAQAVTGESRTVQAASWQVAEVTARRLWLDVFGWQDVVSLNVGDLGAGVSADVTPGDAYCAGAGWWRDEWFAYVGAHVSAW